MVTGEEHAGARVAQADVGRLVPRRVDHLEVSAGAERDPVAIFHRLGGRFGRQEVVGDGVHRRQFGNLVWRSAVPGGHCCGLADETGRVVVPIDQRWDPLVHHEPPTVVAHETGRHPDVVDVEMGTDEPPDRGVGETEDGQPGGDGGEAIGGVHPAIDHRDLVVALDHVRVDPAQPGEGKRDRDDVDAVAERPGTILAHPWTLSLTAKLTSMLTRKAAGAPDSSTVPPISTTWNDSMASMVSAALASTAPMASSNEVGEVPESRMVLVIMVRN